LYALANPVRYIDPSGNVATLCCDRLSEIFIVKADIQIYGPGASASLAGKWETDIENIWNGRWNLAVGGFDKSIVTNAYYRGIPVIFDVNVYYREPVAPLRRNLLGEPIRPKTGEAQNMIIAEEGYIPVGLHPGVEMDRSYSWDWGVWWEKMPDTVVAHEAGHIFGLGHYYGDPMAVAEGWIMALENGSLKPGAGEIDDIIGLWGCGFCVPPWLPIVIRSNGG
jgi:hypothetical protein